MANELRVRTNFVAGGLSAGMLTSDTLMSSAGLADLPAIGATQQAALTLWRTDIVGRVTQKEVVYVTAHTAAATTATVTRGREGTTAQTWLSGDRWSLTTIASDLLTVCTASTRPATPYTGMQIYETDTRLRPIWDGASWEQYLTAEWLTSAGALASNVNSLQMQKKGTIGAGNILWSLSHRANDKDLLLYAYDGTTFRNFFYFDWVNLVTLSGQKLSMEGNPLHLYAAGDANHKIMYKNNPGGGAGDGPWITGYNKGHLGTCIGAEQWQFAWDSAGTCTARGQVACSGISNNGSILTGQGRGFSQARFHFAGDGNDLHVNWGAGLQFWVDVTNVKTFVIPHPTFKTKYLVHACIEGPEAAVLYRGQAQLEGGWAEIPLPAYFEALCAEEGRSVQLTCIADDPMDEWCPVLHATYPRNGKFYVGLGSGMVINDQRFWWEVKAVRKDVAPINVEPLRKDVVVHGDGPYTYYKEK